MKEILGISKDDITVKFVKTHLKIVVTLILKFFDIIYEQGKQIQMLTQKLEESEARFSKDSSSSSKPPSSDSLYKPAPKSLRKKSQKASGGQKGHKGSTLQRIEHPDETMNHYPTGRCQGCGKEIIQSNCYPSEFRQVLEIMINLHAVEHVAHEHICTCGYKQKAKMPQDVKAPVQYGNSVKAFIMYLRNDQMIPYNRITPFFGDVVGIQVSPGTIATLYKVMYR